MEKRDTKKSIRNLLLFVLLIFITFYVIFKDQNPKEIIDVVRSADLKFVRISCAVLWFYIFYVKRLMSQEH